MNTQPAHEHAQRTKGPVHLTVNGPTCCGIPTAGANTSSLIVDHDCAVGNATGEALVGGRRILGLSPGVTAELVAEVGPLPHERRQVTLVFADRLPATLVRLRHGTTHDELACCFRVDRSALTRAGHPGRGHAGHALWGSGLRRA
ncbi:transposase family protein [Streptomyces sp. NBC_00723]|uniref:transposase family protein n=1 Tax=Streptomyces sp. NBC_00723 TaxID=2903673 RepID=UPI00386454D5